jgi:glycosyltransferase involved in cell wall biosynthesis
VILKATIIISIYKDLEALKCVLWGLSLQTESNFEVIVAEDCCEPSTAEYLKNLPCLFAGLFHVFQDDIGFRKTRAVNRAIAAARSEYLIFLDGDCIPHPKFVAMHLEHSEKERVLVGRRMHLGRRVSLEVRNDMSQVRKFFSWTGLCMSFLALHCDGVRNFEIGSPSKTLHQLLKGRYLSIVGCNFSCAREDILRINGYDEDLPGVGGEDGDLEWRFRSLGVITKNVKYQAVVYHLYHPSRRADVSENLRISEENRNAGRFFCTRGVSEHMSEPSYKSLSKG